MVSVEYFTVFILLMLICRTSAGVCRCLNQQECPRCVSGCEFGFTGSRCQYANPLAFSSCQGRNAFAADGDYSKCESLRGGFLTCTNIEPPGRFNTIRIIHEKNTVLRSSFYVMVQRKWVNTDSKKEVSKNITEYSTTVNNLTGTFMIDLKARVCEIEVSYECKHSGECNLECKCNNASDCLNNTAECPSGCAPGYFEVSGGCQVCQTGYYGDGCSSRCGGGCKQGNCSHVNGSCDCKDGWRGRKCSEKCPGGTYGHSCSSSCSRGCYSTVPCDHVTGECYGRRCKDGWTHLNDRLQRCDKKACSVGCDGECEPTNGRCDNCKPGWKHRDTSLPKCDSECTSGHYGHDCQKTCSEGCKSRNQCNHINGSCTCKDGWTGTKCLSTCPSRTYGSGCRTPCGEGCQEGTCDHVDGRCHCTAGWEGDRCDTKCSAGLYGPDCSKTCNEGCVPEGCDYVDGYCDQCKDGWTGSNCEYRCRRWKYGPACTKTCGRNCNSCHHVSGSCGSECRPGWYGENCTDTCPPGLYGDGCKSECNKACKPEKCNPTNGRCGSECREGWTGEECIDECVPGTHGENCVFNCSEGCINQSCDRVSGRCEDCLEGWQHHDLNTSRCDKKCENGTYGKGCSLECSDNCKNQSCHHMVGACLYGCLDGRSGVYCETSETSDPGFRIAVPLMIIFLVLLLLSLYTVL